MTESAPTVRTLDPPVPKPVFERVLNPLMKRLLRSRFHGVVSDAILLLTFTGRKSGTEYTTPVAYERRGETLYVTSQTDRVWWKNLRGGAQVTVRVSGKRRRGYAEVIEDPDDVAAYVSEYIERHGMKHVNRLAIAIEGGEVPDRETLAAGLTDTVVVRIELNDEV